MILQTLYLISTLVSVTVCQDVSEPPDLMLADDIARNLTFDEDENPLVSLIPSDFAKTCEEWRCECENDKISECTLPEVCEEHDIKSTDCSENSRLDRHKRAYFNPRGQTWPGGLYSYVFDRQISPTSKMWILKAFKEMEAKVPCVKFRPATRSSTRYIVHTSSTQACFATTLGYDPRRKTVVNVSDKCGYGTAMHEVFHALGAVHTQTRPDRDRYVMINWQNIQPNMMGNFKKQPGRITKNDNRYDFRSTMHYPYFAFNKHPRIGTLKPRDPRIQLKPYGHYPLDNQDYASLAQWYGCSRNSRRLASSNPDKKGGRGRTKRAKSVRQKARKAEQIKNKRRKNRLRKHRKGKLTKQKKKKGKKNRPGKANKTKKQKNKKKGKKEKNKNKKKFKKSGRKNGKRRGKKKGIKKNRPENPKKGNIAKSEEESEKKNQPEKVKKGKISEQNGKKNRTEKGKKGKKQKNKNKKKLKKKSDRMDSKKKGRKNGKKNKPKTNLKRNNRKKIDKKLKNKEKNDGNKVNAYDPQNRIKRSLITPADSANIIGNDRNYINPREYKRQRKEWRKNGGDNHYHGDHPFMDNKD